MHWGVVQFIIKDSSPVILYRIFNSSDENDNYQRDSVQPRVRCAENAEKLEGRQFRTLESISMSKTYSKDNQEEEVNVGNIVELIPEIFGNKAQWGVLCRPDLVPPILS